MITKIGVIFQDPNSFGLLKGLCNRLKCKADFVAPPGAIGKPRILPKKKLEQAWRHFEKMGVDLVVRYTDADGDRWQDIRRKELSRVPSEASEFWICGVAVNNNEEWLALDPDYLAQFFQVSTGTFQDVQDKVGIIKRLIAQAAQSEESKSDVVARIVRDAPRDTFRQWLRDESLRSFYSDCRAAAARANCETPNELDSQDDA